MAAATLETIARELARHLLRIMREEMEAELGLTTAPAPAAKSRTWTPERRARQQATIAARRAKAGGRRGRRGKRAGETSKPRKAPVAAATPADPAAEAL